MPSASSIRHKPSSWDCASIWNVKQRHRKDTTNLKFRGFQVEREYCEIFQAALNYRVTWAHDLLPIATLPPVES